MIIIITTIKKSTFILMQLVNLSHVKHIKDLEMNNMFSNTTEI